jgi:hypothetical protein
MDPLIECENKDTKDKQHQFLVAAPMQPKQDIINSISPTPMKAYINLQK